MSQLRQLDYGLYSWLRRDNKQWLAENSPTKMTSAPNWTDEELAEFDCEIAALLSSVARKLKTANDHPKRASKAAILNDIGRYEFAVHYRTKLPQTWSTLARLAENMTEWAIRRIPYYGRQLRLRGKPVTRWALILHASLALYMNDPRVQQAIDAELNRSLSN